MDTKAQKFPMTISTTSQNTIKTVSIATIRIMMGGIFLIFGIDGFLRFVPVGPSTPEAAHFIGSIMATGYLFQVLKVTEIVCGVLLLINRYVPLALTILAPIILNIAGYLLILNHAGQPMAFFLLFAEIFLAYGYRENFKGLFQKPSYSNK